MFTGWSGACSGTGQTCTFALNGDATVVASFHALPVLSVAITGAGGGTVASTPGADPLAKAEFNILRERLIKIGARVIERLARIRIQLPTSCPEGELFRTIALGLAPSG